MTTETLQEALPALETVIDPCLFKAFEEGSYYTVTGAGGDLEKEWVPELVDLMKKEGIGTPIKFYTFKGEQMNNHYGLSRSVAYPKDLTFLAFPLVGLDTGKLAIFKLKMQDRWFDDIVQNNRRHMEEQENS